MIQRLLFLIAGIDRKTMLQCPVSDRIWASHIGFSLCVSFTVVLGVSFIATGYMVSSVELRMLLSSVIALTVFMFDRALFQSDWFVQGALSGGESGAVRVWGKLKRLSGRFLRVATRLTMSLGLAWVIALFLELALFSDTIRDKIERDRAVANQPVYEKIDKFQAELERNVARRAESLATHEQALREALAEVPASDRSKSSHLDSVEQENRALAERETALRAEVHRLDELVQQQAADMNAEELGQRLNPSSSGRAGKGPRFDFAKRQQESTGRLLQARQEELSQLLLRREELRRVEGEQSAVIFRLNDEDRAALASKRATLQAQVDAARNELKQAEADRDTRLASYRQEAFQATYVQRQTDYVDPLARITAYQELKHDPKNGPTIVLFSWMTRFFIIFLEIVPVITKIFFSPPSVYAAKLEVENARERRRALEIAATAEQEVLSCDREMVHRTIQFNKAKASDDRRELPAPSGTNVVVAPDSPSQTAETADAAIHALTPDRVLDWSKTDTGALSQEKPTLERTAMSAMTSLPDDADAAPERSPSSLGPPVIDWRPPELSSDELTGKAAADVDEDEASAPRAPDWVSPFSPPEWWNQFGKQETAIQEQRPVAEPTQPA